MFPIQLHNHIQDMLQDPRHTLPRTDSCLHQCLPPWLRQDPHRSLACCQDMSGGSTCRCHSIHSLARTAKPPSYLLVNVCSKDKTRILSFLSRVYKCWLGTRCTCHPPTPTQDRTRTPPPKWLPGVRGLSIQDKACMPGRHFLTCKSLQRRARMLPALNKDT